MNGCKRVGVWALSFTSARNGSSPGTQVPYQLIERLLWAVADYYVLSVERAVWTNANLTACLITLYRATHTITVYGKSNLSRVLATKQSHADCLDCSGVEKPLAGRLHDWFSNPL